jgi:hypothetical protein
VYLYLTSYTANKAELAEALEEGLKRDALDYTENYTRLDCTEALELIKEGTHDI